MIDVTEIVQIVLAEHDAEAGPQGAAFSGASLLQRAELAIGDPESVPPYSNGTPGLSIVAFRCLLQDTGYPAEVYLPGGDVHESDADPDWSQLRERWVGWGVEIPGEQAWAGPTSLPSSTGEQATHANCLPEAVHHKFPLDGRGGRYTGALIKVYDEVTYRPASTYTFIGIASTASLPASVTEDHAILVPTIHVITPPQPIYPPSPREETRHQATPNDVRDAIIDYLSTAFEPPDRLAATVLLLLLVSSPSSRPPLLQPLGTLAVNFIHEPRASTALFNAVLCSVAPVVVSVALSLPLLHSSAFHPSSPDSASLEAGLLQLASGTVLVVEEDAMGVGGVLQEKAVKNLQTLNDCIKHQALRYEYPYMDSLKMECSLRVAVLSEGRSLLPMDVHVPLLQSKSESPVRAPTEETLTQFRSFLQECRSSDRVSRFTIPDEATQIIQNDFVNQRRASMLSAIDAEDILKRRMRLARLFALLRTDVCLTGQVYAEAVTLDDEISARLTRREALRQQRSNGAPAATLLDSTT